MSFKQRKALSIVKNWQEKRKESKKVFESEIKREKNPKKSFRSIIFIKCLILIIILYLFSFSSHQINFNIQK